MVPSTPLSAEIGPTAFSTCLGALLAASQTLTFKLASHLLARPLQSTMGPKRYSMQAPSALATASFATRERVWLAASCWEAEALRRSETAWSLTVLYSAIMRGMA